MRQPPHIDPLQTGTSLAVDSGGHELAPRTCAVELELAELDPPNPSCRAFGSRAAGAAERTSSDPNGVAVAERLERGLLVGVAIVGTSDQRPKPSSRPLSFGSSQGQTREDYGGDGREGDVAGAVRFARTRQVGVKFVREDYRGEGREGDVPGGRCSGVADNASRASGACVVGSQSSSLVLQVFSGCLEKCAQILVEACAPPSLRRMQRKTDLLQQCVLCAGQPRRGLGVSSLE